MNDDHILTSVWPTGARRIRTQLADRGYHRATITDRALMPPAIAEHAIAVFTRPGNIVLDPDCGAGTTVVEALRAGRHAIGLTGQCTSLRLARTNVTQARARGAPVNGMVLVLDSRYDSLAAARSAGLAGHVDLVLTTLRPAGPAGDPADALGRLGALLIACRPLLRPGGYVVITTPPHRHPLRHELLDVPGETLALGTAAGLVPVARCLGLTASVRTRRVTSPGLHRAAAHLTNAGGLRPARPVYYTAHVFWANPGADTPTPAGTRP